jgi:hypothetical protein
VTPAVPAGGAGPDPDSFLSGESGEVSGLRLTLERTLSDLALDLGQLFAATGRRLDRLAATQPPRSVLALSVYRPGSRLAEALRELRSRRHEVAFALGATAREESTLAGATVARGLGGGKFENLNRVLDRAPEPARYDWILLVDDDVRLPRRFLDRALALCERFRLDMAQPAQTLRSHAAWRVTRRRPLSLVRYTRFVEIGPVTLLSPLVAQRLMPFPELRFGWGLDLHWSALAEEHGWRLGVLDAVPVRHEDAPVGTAYPRADAIAEATRFLSGRPYLPSTAAQETIATCRRLRAAPRTRR